MNGVVRTVYLDQQELLRGVMQLYAPNGFDCDVTYGNGKFYTGIPIPRMKFDLDPQVPGVIKADSEDLPINAASITSLVFDPPFLTYVRAERTGNGAMIMANRFSGYWRYSELESHYTGTLKEASRVLKPKGVLVFKCQDIVHNHSLHPTHVNVINWASQEGFVLLDLFILAAKHRLPSPNRGGVQKHARIFHSYFLIFQKK